MSCSAEFFLRLLWFSWGLLTAHAQLSSGSNVVLAGNHPAEATTMSPVAPREFRRSVEHGGDARVAQHDRVEPTVARSAGPHFAALPSMAHQRPVHRTVWSLPAGRRYGCAVANLAGLPSNRDQPAGAICQVQWSCGRRRTGFRNGYHDLRRRHLLLEYDRPDDSGAVRRRNRWNSRPQQLSSLEGVWQSIGFIIDDLAASFRMVRRPTGVGQFAVR